MQSDSVVDDSAPIQSKKQSFKFLINIGQTFWSNFTYYVEFQTKQIEENELIPESIKQDLLRQLNGSQSMTKQNIQQRQFDEIIQDNQKQFQDKVAESAKLDYKKDNDIYQQVAMIIRHKGQGFNILPNQEHIKYQNKLQNQRQTKKIIEQQNQWFKQSQLTQAINSYHSKAMIDQFIQNIDRTNQATHKKFQIQEMHLNNHYSSKINLLEFEIENQLKEYRVR